MKKAVEIKSDPEPKKLAPRIEPGSPLHNTILMDLQDPRNSYYMIAKKHGVGAPVVQKIAFNFGLRRNEPLTDLPHNERAKLERQTFNKERRAVLLDDTFEKLEQMLQEADDPAALEKIVNALAKLIDKRRLEEGEATSRSESTSSEAKQSLAGKLDELALRRAQNSSKGLETIPSNAPNIREEIAEEKYGTVD